MWNEGWTHNGMMGGANGGWHWLYSFHGILSVLFLAIIIFALVAIIRDWRRRDGESPAETALGTRYAKGETAHDEYLEMKRRPKA